MASKRWPAVGTERVRKSDGRMVLVDRVGKKGPYVFVDYAVMDEGQYGGNTYGVTLSEFISTTRAIAKGNRP